MCLEYTSLAEKSQRPKESALPCAGSSTKSVMNFLVILLKTIWIPVTQTGRESETTYFAVPDGSKYIFTI